jgi:hypothetical protein
MRKPILPAVSESAWQSQFIDMAHLFGWRLAHFRPAKTQRGWRTPVQGDGKGWPDNVLVRERVIFVELKRVGGKLSTEQQEWQDWLEQAGQECYVWTIDDMEQAVEVLRRRDGGN